MAAPAPAQEEQLAAPAPAQEEQFPGFGAALERGRSDTLFLGGSDSEGDGGGGDGGGGDGGGGGAPGRASHIALVRAANERQRQLHEAARQHRANRARARERERREHAAAVEQRLLLLIDDPYITQRLGAEVVNALASRFGGLEVSLDEVRRRLDALETAARRGGQGGGRRRKSKRRRTKRHKRRKRNTRRRRRKYRKRRRSRRGGKKRRSMRGGAPPKGMKSWFENDYDVQRFRSAWQTKTKKVI